MTLSVRSPDELIAVIPHLLGFKPEESLVFLPMSSELPAARVDLPTTPHDRGVVWSSIRDAYVRHVQPGSSLAIVCLTADRGMATGVGHEFAARVDSIGIDTRVTLWADDTRWADLDTGDMGLQTEAARERIAAATVLTGRAQPAVNRDSLAESLVGDREPVAALLPETREAALESTAKAEGRWALARMQRFHGDGIRLKDGDAARLLVAIESIPTRDRLWLNMNRGTAGSHVALWTDMTKRAPDDVRAAPASLLGFASWLSGHGALAWCALAGEGRGIGGCGDDVGVPQDHPAVAFANHWTLFPETVVGPPLVFPWLVGIDLRRFSHRSGSLFRSGSRHTVDGHGQQDG